MSVTTKNIMLLAAAVLLSVLPLVLYHGATDQQNGPETASETMQARDEGTMPTNDTGTSAGVSQAPRPEGQTRELFGGADDQAKKLVALLHPDYEPWFSPIWEPPSEEIASLLFAVQAALGAGFVGYYFGYVRGRRRQAGVGER